MTSEEKKALIKRIEEEVLKVYSPYDDAAWGTLEIVERVILQDDVK